MSITNRYDYRKRNTHLTPRPRAHSDIYASLKITTADIAKCGKTQEDIEAFAKAALFKVYCVAVMRLGGDNTNLEPLK